MKYRGNIMQRFNVKFIYSRICVLFVILMLKFLEIADARNKVNTEVHCESIKSQTSYSLRDMSGMWYGIEILENVVRSRPPIDSCIKVELQDRGNNHVNLIWREKNLDVTYKFFIDDMRHLGIWSSLGNQDVNEKPNGYDYEQFAGKVFVMKASDSNVVLTFCSLTKLFTLVLSKTYTMNSTELTSIHNLVDRFGVPKPKDIKRFCKNGAFAAVPPAKLLLIVTFAAITFVTKLRSFNT